MTPAQLSLFTLIYTSDEMRAAFEINKEGTHLEKLEFYLVKNIDLFNVQEFSLICNTIQAEINNNDSIKFDTLLENRSSNVISWLSNDDITSVKDLIHITNAYIVRSSKVKLPLRFFELVELTALKLST
jgi:hypothetical protein